MTEYKVKIVLDDCPVEIGDWLPQDEEHYNRVGPFRREIDGEWVDVDWATWWEDPESRVENWHSFGMILLAVCDCCGAENEVEGPGMTSLWGLDDLVWGKYYTGTFTRDELVEIDTYLGDVFDDLVSEATD